MKSIASFFRYLGTYTKRLGNCGNVGLIVGALSGGMLTLLFISKGGSLSLTDNEAIKIAGILTIFSWLVLVFILTILIRLRFSSIAVGSFLITLFVTFITVYLSHKFELFEYAWLIGMLVGISLTALICKFFKRLIG